MSWTLEVEGANDSGLPRHPCREIASGIKISLQRLILHLTLRNQNTYNPGNKTEHVFARVLCCGRGAPRRHLSLVARSS